MKTQTTQHYDVVIIGGGLAGLSLARQLLLNSGKTILLLEKRAALPMALQKYGEATVQLSAYYFSKVLDLEEHLLREHFMKYNLRFYWTTEGKENSRFEEYCQSYIRNLSNIATYQLDRNKLEAELLRLNLESPQFTFQPGMNGLEVALSNDGPHSVSYQVAGEPSSATADWIVDTSGRGKFLAHKLGLTRQNPIRHGAHFFWVEGLVNIDKLTDLSPKEIRLKKDRAAIGHLPFWLATNHFCGEGFWFWVIPLQGKTSLGLVYDNRLIDRARIASLPQLIDWVCTEFPLFARDLPFRKVLCHSALKDYSHDCGQTISAARWAIAGEAGRFTDPLYSPGGDLISLYNTLITDAILTDDAGELTEKTRLYEQLMKSFYEAYVPSFAVSYYALGDQEAMTLKYTWELAIYFSFYVFPFINDLFTNRRFIVLFVNRFSRLGQVNRNLQQFITDFYHWKKEHCTRTRRPIFNDFTEIGALRVAESTFYRVGVTVDEAREVLDEQLASLLGLARFVVAHVYSVVLGDSAVLTNRSFVESIDLDNFCFDETGIRERYAVHAENNEQYVWAFDPSVLARFRTSPCTPQLFIPQAESIAALSGQGGH
jgi:flavin-dependent dehydrogenase